MRQPMNMPLKDAVPTCGAVRRGILRRRMAPYTVPRVDVRHGDAMLGVRAAPHPVGTNLF